MALLASLLLLTPLCEVNDPVPYCINYTFPSQGWEAETHHYY